MRNKRREARASARKSRLADVMQTDFFIEFFGLRLYVRYYIKKSDMTIMPIEKLLTFFLKIFLLTNKGRIFDRFCGFYRRIDAFLHNCLL